MARLEESSKKQVARAEWVSEGYTIRYRCPQCQCSHVINVGIDDPDLPKWDWNGSFEEPTLKPSVNVKGRCHHDIENGFIRFCENDPVNRMKGTIPLPEI